RRGGNVAVAPRTCQPVMVTRDSSARNRICRCTRVVPSLRRCDRRRLAPNGGFHTKRSDSLATEESVGHRCLAWVVPARRYFFLLLLEGQTSFRERAPHLRQGNTVMK